MKTTANEIRNELAMSQRMKKTQSKWLGWCEDFAHLPSANGNNNLKVGLEADFTIRKQNGNCINFSFRRGIVFAFNESGKRMAVTYKGRIYWVWNKQDENPDDCVIKTRSPKA